jgi:hypothetical protein
MRVRRTCNTETSNRPRVAVLWHDILPTQQLCYGTISCQHSSKRVRFRTVVSETVSFGGFKQGRLQMDRASPGAIHVPGRCSPAHATRVALGSPLHCQHALHRIHVRSRASAQHTCWAAAGQQSVAAFPCFVSPLPPSTLTARGPGRIGTTGQGLGVLSHCGADSRRGTV